MQYFTEKTITDLQESYKQFKSVQFQGISEDPAGFKRELAILQSYNILQLAPSDITLVQWDTVSPIEGTTEIKVINVGDISALLSTHKSKTTPLRSTVGGNYVYIPSLLTFGMYTAETNKLLINGDTILKEPYIDNILPELAYVKKAAAAALLPTLISDYTTTAKAAAASRKKRGFTTLPEKGDRFKIRTYASMKKEFGEGVSTIQLEDAEGGHSPVEVKYILPSHTMYGVTFIKMCNSICGVTGTITRYNKETGIIAATYTINDVKVSSITEIPDGDETLELESPLVIHEQHITKI